MRLPQLLTHFKVDVEGSEKLRDLPKVTQQVSASQDLTSGSLAPGPSTICQGTCLPGQEPMSLKAVQELIGSYSKDPRWVKWCQDMIQESPT